MMAGHTQRQTVDIACALTAFESVAFYLAALAVEERPYPTSLAMLVSLSKLESPVFGSRKPGEPRQPLRP